MFKNKVSYSTLVPKYRQFETRSNTGRLGYLSFDKPGEINSSLNVITYIIDRLKTLSSSSLPAFKFGYSTQTTKKAILLCSSDEKGSFIPVTRTGFRLLITSAVHDIWYTEFMNTGMSLKILAEEMVANVKFATTSDESKKSSKGSGKKTFFASDSIIEFDNLMEGFHNLYISSNSIEFTDEFNQQLNAVYSALLTLLGNTKVDKSSVDTRIDFKTNDPVAIALVILWDYACVCDSLFDIATRVSNDVCKKVSLPIILDTTSSDTITNLYRDFVFEHAAGEFRNSINTIKMSELIGFNPSSLSLGFNKRARLIMTELYASQITNLFTSVLNTIALESKFKACSDMLFTSNFISACRQNSVVAKEIRILAPIFWSLENNKKQVAIKDYDLTSQLSAIPNEVMNYVKDLSKFVESICYVDPQIDDLYCITTINSEKGPVDSIIRVNLIKRLADPSYVLRCVKLSDNVLQSDYKKINFLQVPYSAGEKTSHVKIANNLDRIIPGIDIEEMYLGLNLSPLFSVGDEHSCVIVGDLKELRDFVSSKSKFYEIQQLDAISGECVIELRSSCYVIKPNKRYAGVILGDYSFENDSFELASINPQRADHVELLLSVTHQALGLPKQDLVKLYESRINKLRDLDSQSSCIFSARFANYENSKIAASPLNLYLSVKGLDGKTNMNNLVVNPVSAFLDDSPDSDTIKKVCKNKDALIPVRAVLQQNETFDLELPLNLLSDDAKYRLISDPSRGIRGPLSAKTGEPIWTITLLNEHDNKKGFFSELDQSELFRLRIKIDEYNTDYGSRSIWRREDRMLISYQFEDPDLNDFIRRGSSVAFDSGGLMKGNEIFSRYYSNVLKTLTSNSDTTLTSVGSFRISLALNMLKVILLYVAYRLNDNWSSFDVYDLNSDELKTLRENIAVLRAYLIVAYHPDTPMSVFGCPTTVKLEEFYTILASLIDSLTIDLGLSEIKKDKTKVSAILSAISSLIVKLEGDELNDLLRYQLIPLPKPRMADLKLIGKLTTTDPIKVLEAPTLADNVNLPGLELYLGSEITKQISKCCVDFVDSCATDQVL